VALVAHELGAERSLGFVLVELNRYAVEPLHLSRVSLDVGA